MKPLLISLSILLSASTPLLASEEKSITTEVFTLETFDVTKSLNIQQDNNSTDIVNNALEEMKKNENHTVETQESFLSSVEYGRMLYKSPRGISCAKCHGKTGQGGQKIAKYYDKHKNPKLLKGVDITIYSLEQLKSSLKNEYRENNRRKRHKIMPMYYLTDEEVLAIFNYLQQDVLKERYTNENK